LSANISWNSLQGHHCNSASIFRNLCLIRINDIHDDAALEHFSHSALYATGACYFSHDVLLRFNRKIEPNPTSSFQ